MPALSKDDLRSFVRAPRPTPTGTDKEEEPAAAGNPTPTADPTEIRTRPAPSHIAEPAKTDQTTPRDHGGITKRAVHLARATGDRLRKAESNTHFGLSAMVNAAVASQAGSLREQLAGGPPLLRRRPERGREAFTLNLWVANWETLGELSELGGISRSEVAGRAVEGFLDRLDAGEFSD